jgi:aerobic-type carbon monoxide dehydrogenase small subunit (CoxS/CutS family)
MLAVQAEGCSVTTIEGVSPLSGLSQLQESFRDHHALQCGFCTPGMVLTLHALFGNNPNAGESEIREALSGQLCRCTGYQGIMAAAEAYGKKFRVEQRPNSVQLREAKREKHAS